MSPTRRSAVAQAMLAAGLAAATADAQPALPDSGAVVRVQARGTGAQIFTVVGRRPDTLLLRRRNDGFVTGVPLAAVERLDVREHRSRGEGRGRGALIGLAVGAVPTLALLPSAVRSDRSCSECYIPVTAVLAVLGTAFTALTTAAGAIVGHNAPGQEWRRLTPADLRLGAAPLPGGRGAVAVRLRF